MTARAGIRGSAEAAEIYVHPLMVANERTLCAHHPGAHLLVCGAYWQVRGRTPVQCVVQGRLRGCALREEADGTARDQDYAI